MLLLFAIGCSTSEVLIEDGWPFGAVASAYVTPAVTFDGFEFRDGGFQAAPVGLASALYVRSAGGGCTAWQNSLRSWADKSAAFLASDNPCEEYPVWLARMAGGGLPRLGLSQITLDMGFDLGEVGDAGQSLEVGEDIWGELKRIGPGASAGLDYRADWDAAACAWRPDTFDEGFGEGDGLTFGAFELYDLEGEAQVGLIDDDTVGIELDAVGTAMDGRDATVALSARIEAKRCEAPDVGPLVWPLAEPLGVEAE